MSYYTEAKAKHSCSSDVFNDLDLIFSVALQNKDRFPAIVLSTPSPSAYIDQWISYYFEATKNLPSKRIALPKRSCTDPSIRLIVQISQKKTDRSALLGEKYHNLFMSSENIQGNLLEEFISIKTRCYGFLWCCGNILKSIDFCNTDGSLLVQIKNKSNTENSSSSSVREGTKILKWYRLGTMTINGQKLPKYRWDIFNQIVNSHKTEGFNLPACNIKEDDYQSFLVKTAKKNNHLITEL